MNYLQRAQCFCSSFSRRFNNATSPLISTGLYYLRRWLWPFVRSMSSLLLYVWGTILRSLLVLVVVLVLVLWSPCAYIAAYFEDRRNEREDA